MKLLHIYFACAIIFKTNKERVMCDTSSREEKWQCLLELLHQADHIQQSLLGNAHAKASYEFHEQLHLLIDDFREWAEVERIKVD